MPNVEAFSNVAAHEENPEAPALFARDRRRRCFLASRDVALKSRSVSRCTLPASDEFSVICLMPSLTPFGYVVLFSHEELIFKIDFVTYRDTPQPKRSNADLETRVNEIVFFSA